MGRRLLPTAKGGPPRPKSFPHLPHSGPRNNHTEISAVAGPLETEESFKTQRIATFRELLAAAPRSYLVSGGREPARAGVGEDVRVGRGEGPHDRVGAGFGSPDDGREDRSGNRTTGPGSSNYGAGRTVRKWDGEFRDRPRREIQPGISSFSNPRASIHLVPATDSGTQLAIGEASSESTTR